MGGIVATLRQPPKPKTPAVQSGEEEDYDDLSSDTTSSWESVDEAGYDLAWETLEEVFEAACEQLERQGWQRLAVDQRRLELEDAEAALDKEEQEALEAEFEAQREQEEYEEAMRSMEKEKAEAEEAARIAAKELAEAEEAELLAAKERAEAEEAEREARREIEEAEAAEAEYRREEAEAVAAEEHARKMLEAADAAEEAGGRRRVVACLRVAVSRALCALELLEQRPLVSCGGPAMRRHLLTCLLARCGNVADKADRIAERAILKDKARNSQKYRVAECLCSKYSRALTCENFGQAVEDARKAREAAIRARAEAEQAVEDAVRERAEAKSAYGIALRERREAEEAIVRAGFLCPPHPPLHPHSSRRTCSR